MATEGHTVIFAYAGPETLLPMTSVVAAVAGVVLMLGRSSLRYLMGVFQAACRPVLGVRRAAPRHQSAGTTE